jgi:hypothetical protein
MEEFQKLIVVPWDFTYVAENALAHAVKISRMVGNDICLLHIVDSGISLKAEAQKRGKLKQLTEENSKKYNVTISYHISKGSIFSDIAEYACGYGNSWYEGYAKAYRQLGIKSFSEINSTVHCCSGSSR